MPHWAAAPRRAAAIPAPRAPARDAPTMTTSQGNGRRLLGGVDLARGVAVTMTTSPGGQSMFMEGVDLAMGLDDTEASGVFEERSREERWHV